MEMLVNNQGMQNISTPLSATTHLIFCLLATIVYFLQFYRRGSWHYMLIMLAVDLTYFTQTPICRSRSAVTGLGIAEVVILIAAFIVYIPYGRKLKAENAKKDEETDEMEKKRRLAERAEEQKDSRPVDNAFEDQT